MTDSTIDDIIAEEQFERSMRHRMTVQYKNGVHVSRVSKVRQIQANIERNLKKKGPYPLDRLETFIENYEKYPEVRPFAQQVLPKVIEGESIKQKRLDAYNRLRRLMREMQHQ